MQGKQPCPKACSTVCGALGRGSGLLDGHDTLPAQDQACAIHDFCAAVDDVMDSWGGAAVVVLLK